MKNHIIFTFLLLFSCSSNSQVVDCDFDSMNENIKRLITKYEPITSCKQSKDDNFEGYRINNEKFQVKIVKSDFQLLDLSQQGSLNDEKVSLKEFFNSLYIKGIAPVNEYAKAQKKIITSSTPNGVIEITNGTAYFNLDTGLGPFKNYASIVFNNEKDNYWSISSDEKSAIITVLLD